MSGAHRVSMKSDILAFAAWAGTACDGLAAMRRGIVTETAAPVQSRLSKTTTIRGRAPKP